MSDPTDASGRQEVRSPADTRPESGLFGDAFSRLIRNEMAVSGFILVCIMAGSSAFAPWVAPHDPQAQERWLEPSGPWFVHPRVAARMPFQVGEEWPAPYAATDPDEVELEVRALERNRLRIAVAEGSVTRILETGRRGLNQLDRVELGEDAWLESEELGRVDEATIAVGEPLPEAMHPAEGELPPLVVFEHVRLAGEYLLRATATDAGGVGSLVKVTEGDGEDVEAGEEPVDRQVIRGEQVLSVRLDGEPFTHLHPMGTDLLGRDIMSRILYGGRISLLVGVVATLVSLTIGVLYGSIAGYVGGLVDGIMMRIVDILYALPFMFLVIILLVMFGRNFIILFVALGAVQWLTMARIVRGQVLSLKEKEFVEAARTVGTRGMAIVGRHLIPNTLGTIVVYATLTVPAVILQEAFLAFLGLTVQTPDGSSLESWGSLTKAGMDLARGGHPWLLIFSAVALSATLFSLNFLGDGLRDALDPRLKGQG